MKYKSNLVAQASGALGGKVASRNKGGDYFRRRALPTNPRTARQVAVRTGFGTLSQFYGQTLTDTQRTAWTQYGAATPIPDRLGDPRTQSGIAAYNRSNTARIQAGLAVIANAPTVFALGTTPLYSAAVVQDEGGDLLAITIKNPDQYTANDHILVYVGAPRGPGVNFFKGPYRFAQSSPGSNAAPTILISALPFHYANGQNMFVRLTASHADGRYSTPGDLTVRVANLSGANLNSLVEGAPGEEAVATGSGSRSRSRRPAPAATE